jgi:hypothetical protein
MTKAIIIDAGGTKIQKVQDQLTRAGWAVERVDTIRDIPADHEAKLFVFESRRPIPSAITYLLAERYCISSERVVMVTEPKSVTCVRAAEHGTEPWLVETKRRCTCLLQEMLNGMFIDILRHAAKLAGTNRLGYCARTRRRLF